MYLIFIYIPLFLDLDPERVTQAQLNEINLHSTIFRFRQILDACCGSRMFIYIPLFLDLDRHVIGSTWRHAEFTFHYF